MTAPLFRTEGAGFSIGDTRLLHGVTLDLPKGRVIGLIGHNGSGKSTLLKLLARQQPPSGGTIAFEGTELSRWGRRDFARKVAYLAQQPPGADGMTARELVALGRYPWHGALGRFSKTDRDKVEEAMVLTGTQAFAARAVDSLSGGERQRVWLAMLVAQDAGCLLLDEPISALDIGHQLEVLDLVRRLSAQKGIGVVVVLHDINMAARFCDELVALKAGTLLAHLPSAEMMTEEMLHAVYGVPMAILPHPDGAHRICFAR